jgi:hypothetical protein
MRAETEGITTCGHARTWACMGPRVQQSACTSFHRESPPANGCPAFPARVAPAAQKPEAKKNDKAKPAKKMPNIPGLDSKLFKMAMAEPESKCTAPTSAGLVPCCGHVTRVGADGRTQGRSWAPYWETVPRMGPRCLGAAVGDAPSPCSCPAVWESGCCAMVCPGP